MPRLASIPILALTLTALLMTGAAADGPSAAAIARIVVEPQSVTLQPAGRQRLRARAYDDQQREVAFSPVWSSSGGLAIDARGEVVAAEAGVFTVTAWDLRGGRLGCATVIVEAAAKDPAADAAAAGLGAGVEARAPRDDPRQPRGREPLTRLDVWPSRVSMRTGRAVRFTALATLADGTAYTPRALRWYADGGAIDEHGTYTAGAAPGVFTVTATARGRWRATARVHIRDSGQSGRIVSVSVTPPRTRLKPGQHVLFQATALDASGRPVPFHPRWSTTGGGTIDGRGRFVATTPGRYAVAALDPVSRVYGTADVWIGDDAGIARLEVRPARVRMSPGETVRFAAVAYDAHGRPLPCAPEWRASGGQIDGRGRYTAGRRLGTFVVTARDRRTGAEGSAAVHVLRGHTPPPHGTGRLVITHWDVGGGNFFRPKAKIELQTQGPGAHQVKLFAVGGAGLTELQAFSCHHGATVRFDTRYDRLGTQALELRLYDRQGRMIARLQRAPR